MNDCQEIKKHHVCDHDYDDIVCDDDGCSPALEAGKAGSLGWPVTDPQLPGSPHVDHQDDCDDHHDHDSHHHLEQLRHNFKTTWTHLCATTLRQLLGNFGTDLRQLEDHLETTWRQPWDKTLRQFRDNLRTTLR